MNSLDKFLRGQLRRDIYFSLGGTFWILAMKYIFKVDISFVKFLYPFMFLFGFYILVTILALIYLRITK